MHSTINGIGMISSISCRSLGKKTTTTQFSNQYYTLGWPCVYSVFIHIRNLEEDAKDFFLHQNISANTFQEGECASLLQNIFNLIHLINPRQHNVIFIFHIVFSCHTFMLPEVLCKDEI